MNYTNSILTMDVNEGLALLPDQSINCCVTSPPYFGLRDYGKEGQIGLEETPELYVLKMVDVFRGVKRVLRNDGTVWLNLGDSYSGSNKGNGDTKTTNKGNRHSSYEKKQEWGVGIKSVGAINNNGDGFCDYDRCGVVGTLKPKDLIGIPWMLAFALRADGWYLRQDIIWHKPNPMPESVTDRCTKSHEYIFLLSKSAKYYYDSEAIRTESKNPEDDLRRLKEQSWDNKNTPDKLRNGIRPKDLIEIINGANKRSVWTVNTMPYKEAHFATFPEQLITDCIKAGCPENGIVLDPFMGAGTTALVARKLNRNYVGIELNPDYVKIAQNRLQSELGLFL